MLSAASYLARHGSDESILVSVLGGGILEPLLLAQWLCRTVRHRVYSPFSFGVSLIAGRIDDKELRIATTDVRPAACASAAAGLSGRARRSFHF